VSSACTQPPLSDPELLRLVAALLDGDEPLPAGAVAFASQAFTWRDVSSELAQLLHDSAEKLALVRAAEPPRLLLFRTGEVTLDVEHERHRLQGAVAPAGTYRVRIQLDGARAWTTATDAGGTFAVDTTIEGSVQLTVTDRAGSTVLVTPWVEH
jgi:hypothetical protein